jgi:hypothetical protein
MFVASLSSNLLSTRVEGGGVRKNVGASGESVALGAIDVSGVGAIDDRGVGSIGASLFTGSLFASFLVSFFVSLFVSLFAGSIGGAEIAELDAVAGDASEIDGAPRLTSTCDVVIAAIRVDGDSEDVAAADERGALDVEGDAPDVEGDVLDAADAMSVDGDALAGDADVLAVDAGGDVLDSVDAVDANGGAVAGDADAVDANAGDADVLAVDAGGDALDVEGDAPDVEGDVLDAADAISVAGDALAGDADVLAVDAGGDDVLDSVAAVANGGAVAGDADAVDFNGDALAGDADVLAVDAGGDVLDSVDAVDANGGALAGDADVLAASAGGDALDVEGDALDAADVVRVDGDALASDADALAVDAEVDDSVEADDALDAVEADVPEIGSGSTGGVEITARDANGDGGITGTPIGGGAEGVLVRAIAGTPVIGGADGDFGRGMSGMPVIGGGADGDFVRAMTGGVDGVFARAIAGSSMFGDEIRGGGTAIAFASSMRLASISDFAFASASDFAFASASDLAFASASDFAFASASDLASAWASDSASAWASDLAFASASDLAFASVSDFAFASIPFARAGASVSSVSGSMTMLGSASFGKIRSRAPVSSASSFSREISPERCAAGTTCESEPTSLPIVRGTSAPQSMTLGLLDVRATAGGSAGGGGELCFAFRFLPFLNFGFESRDFSTWPVSAEPAIGAESMSEVARSTTASRSWPVSHSSMERTARHLARDRCFSTMRSRPASTARWATRSVSNTRYGESSRMSARTRCPSNMRSTPWTSVGTWRPSDWMRTTSCSRTIEGESEPEESRTPSRKRSASANSSSWDSGICWRRTTSSWRYSKRASVQRSSWWSAAWPWISASSAEVTSPWKKRISPRRRPRTRVRTALRPRAARARTSVYTPVVSARLPTMCSRFARGTPRRRRPTVTTSRR